jgi:hypothetical protein
MSSPRILLLRHFEVDPKANGFTARYDVVLNAARTFAMVEEATVGPVGSGATIEIEDLVFTTGRIGRIRRLQAACGLGGPFARAAKALDRYIGKKNITVVLGCTYRSPELYSRIASRAATYVFVEERTRAFGYGARIAPNLRSRCIATIERSGLRRLLGPVKGVVVIQPNEVDAAKKRWKRSVFVIPHAIVDRFVEGEVNGQHTGQILTVGNYQERRNAAGLRQFLDALSNSNVVVKPSVTAISATGFASELSESFSDSVAAQVNVADLAPSYAGAQVVVVPSFVISGSKTTILQGWAARRPVVTTRESAESVGAIDGRDVLVGNSGSELVERCFEVLADPVLAQRLVTGGVESLGLRHSEKAVRSALLSMLDEVWETVR